MWYRYAGCLCVRESRGIREGNEEETLKDGNKKEATRMGVTKWARKQEKKKQS